MISAKISMLIKALLNHLFHQVSIHLHSLSQIRALGTQFSSRGHKYLLRHSMLIVFRRTNKDPLGIHIVFVQALWLLVLLCTIIALPSTWFSVVVRLFQAALFTSLLPASSENLKPIHNQQFLPTPRSWYKTGINIHIWTSWSSYLSFSRSKCYVSWVLMCNTLEDLSYVTKSLLFCIYHMRTICVGEELSAV